MLPFRQQAFFLFKSIIAHVAILNVRRITRYTTSTALENLLREEGIVSFLGVGVDQEVKYFLNASALFFACDNTLAIQGIRRAFFKVYDLEGLSFGYFGNCFLCGNRYFVVLVIGYLGCQALWLELFRLLGLRYS